MILLILICLLTTQFTPGVHSTSQQRKAAAQTQVDVQQLKQQAQELSDAMINDDYERAADLTYPELVKVMGGRTRFIATLARAKKETEGDRFRILSDTVGEPGAIQEVERKHYAIVPTTMRIKVPEGTLVGEAFMIAISVDGGRNWTFVASPGDRERVRALLGPVADKLQIPEYKRPVLIANPS